MATQEKKSRKSYTPIAYLLERGIIKLEELHNLYNSQGAKATADFYNISTGTLYSVLKQHGISESGNRTVLSKLCTDVKRKVVTDLGCNTAKAVAEKHGLSYQAVCKLAKEHGVRLHRAVPWGPEEATQLITELSRSSVEKVANKHGYPVNKLTKLAKVAGVQVA